ncbi:MAG: zinc-binding dehydrogenase [Acidimicrobiia bacterium]|nr:zinc-binding dehydrogenase [Acidimicrobiia bacterium]
MRALQLVAAGTPLRLREVALPPLAPNDVVVDVAAAGICRSDVHYRRGFPAVGPLPLALGHEVAGVVSATGEQVADLEPGQRVCIHYQVGCGECSYCRRGFEQFCAEGKMIGNGRDGGYAEQIVVPARNAIPVPASVSLDHAAVMMCSSATSLHALRKGRLAAGETVAVFGAGGLGMSAIQLAFLEGASRVLAVDVNVAKLRQAERFGAEAIPASDDAVAEILDKGGVDVALDLVGSADVMRDCLDVLAPMGRAVAVGLTADEMAVGPYTDLVSGESELIGTSDHLASEIHELLEYAATGGLLLDEILTETIPLEEAAVNAALDELERFGATLRTVIHPS